MTGINTPSIMIRSSDFPGLFQGADAAAASAQKIYFRLQGMYLWFLILGALVGSLASFLSATLLSAMYTVIAVLLTVGVIVLWIIRARRDDKAWFDCRAVAESARTATWRFMMGTSPFQSADAVEQRFISEMQEIRRARPDCHKYLAGNTAASCVAISAIMKQVRALSFDEKKALYLSQRLLDQKRWYSDKAKTNSTDSTKWFALTTILQLLAVVLAIIQAVIGGLGLNAVSIITTCIAVATAWSQMKRHDELTKTYALAAQELGELESIAETLRADDFSQFVEQVEEAVSREHTMWCSRRDTLLHDRMQSK